MKTMAEAVEVLAKSNFEAEMGDGWESLPAQIKPGWLNEAKRQIDALSAAGYGPVREAQEAAWDEGFAAGKSRAVRHMSDEPNLSLHAANPYRATR